MMPETLERKAVLTIAGSDSGGGAGIQADLLTFAALGVFGTSALTCVTAQNPRGVTGVAALDPDLVARQIAAVCDAFPVEAAKTGMLYSAPIIHAVAAAASRIPILVVDPVMVAASGAQLLEPEAVDTLCGELIPQARVITPNLDEAKILCGHPIASVGQMREAARELSERFEVGVVIKGGHLPGDTITDVLYDDGVEQIFNASRLAAETHGAGCMFSAAITAFLARGDLLEEAVRQAREYIHAALSQAIAVGPFHPLNFFAEPESPSTP